MHRRARQVRDTHRINKKDPLTFFVVKQRIEAALSDYAGRFAIVPAPNITQKRVLWSRKVGYAIERIVLDESIEAITASPV